MSASKDWNLAVAGTDREACKERFQAPVLGMLMSVCNIYKDVYGGMESSK